MSEHFTLRLRAETSARLRQRATRMQTPPRTLAQRYVEEGLRRDDHPMVHFVDGPSGRRARMVGSGLDVWEVIATVRDNDGDLTETRAYLDIPMAVVHAAVSYYGDHREEIDAEIDHNHAEWAEGLAAVQRGQQAIQG